MMITGSYVNKDTLYVTVETHDNLRARISHQLTEQSTGWAVVSQDRQFDGLEVEVIDNYINEFRMKNDLPVINRVSY